MRQLCSRQNRMRLLDWLIAAVETVEENRVARAALGRHHHELAVNIPRAQVELIPRTVQDHIWYTPMWSARRAALYTFHDGIDVSMLPPTPN